MNTQLAEFFVQVIRSLFVEERAALEEKLFFESSEPATGELAKLALRCSSFDFLSNEPDLYSCEDGEPIDVAC